jgi:hypothetical protein
MAEDDPHKIARDLLTHIGAPPGAANVMVRRSAGRPYLVVRLSRGVRVPEGRLPNTFSGLEVVYERRYPGRPLEFRMS